MEEKIYFQNAEVTVTNRTIVIGGAVWFLDQINRVEKVIVPVSWEHGAYYDSWHWIKLGLGITWLLINVFILNSLASDKSVNAPSWSCGVISFLGGVAMVISALCDKKYPAEKDCFEYEVEISDSSGAHAVLTSPEESFVDAVVAAILKAKNGE